MKNAAPSQLTKPHDDATLCNQTIDPRSSPLFSAETSHTGTTYIQESIPFNYIHTAYLQVICSKSPLGSRALPMTRF